jgi:flagellar motor switch protein FliN
VSDTASETVDYAPLEPTGDIAPAGPGGAASLDRLSAVPVDVAVELGRTRMTIGDAMRLAAGSIVTLDRLSGEPVDLLVNGKPVARGEVVVIDEQLGLRITEIVEG